AAKMINARSETVLQKPSFKAPFRKRRCIIPMDGYYEWKMQSTHEAGAYKQPYYFSMEDDGPMAVAGIWEHWLGADGSDVETCSIMTVASNDLVSLVHHRMPVILDQAHFQNWLYGSTNEALKLLRPYYGERQMRYHPVSRLVSNNRNEGEGLIEPIDLDSDPNSTEFKPQMSLF
ncbi:MAG: SOS response-associated peptidase, partial [Alphaproteobacteria bacterium]|nr:SOS response-associated peptidase [Alphaproteobacteria bacterium]